MAGILNLKNHFPNQTFRRDFGKKNRGLFNKTRILQRRIMRRFCDRIRHYIKIIISCCKERNRYALRGRQMNNGIFRND